jgi:hypothetical protein
MKKGIAILLILAGTIIWSVMYVRKNESTSIPNPGTTIATTTTHTNPHSGVTFTYPKILTVTDQAGTTTIHHEVAFTHHDYCDFKGEIDTTIPVLTDFHVVMHTVDKPLVQTMKSESPYIPAENFVNGQVVASPGFIDPITVGMLSGYGIFEGAEGCGQTTYYFPIHPTKTLVVRQQFITVFSGSIALNEKDRAEAVPGVINRERESAILSTILNSLRVK